MDTVALTGMTEWYEVVTVVVSFAIGAIATSKYYAKFKKALHNIRECIDSIDNALADDKITKEEVKQIVEDCKKIFKEL